MNRYTAEEWELKKELERAEAEIDEGKNTIAEAEFRKALALAGISEQSIAKLAAMGPVLIMRKYEANELRFASTAHEKAFEAALNTWGRSIF